LIFDFATVFDFLVFESVTVSVSFARAAGIPTVREPQGVFASGIPPEIHVRWQAGGGIRATTGSGLSSHWRSDSLVCNFRWDWSTVARGAPNQFLSYIIQVPKRGKYSKDATKLKSLSLRGHVAGAIACGGAIIRMLARPG
jgi:hypothetical protein